MPSADESTAREKTLLSRRNVIGTALWAAPAITLATAAPALAASGDTLNLTGLAAVAGKSALSLVNDRRTISFTVKAISTHASTGTVSITITLPPPAVNGLGVLLNSYAYPTVSGWTLTSSTSNSATYLANIVGSPAPGTSYTFSGAFDYRVIIGLVPAVWPSGSISTAGTSTDNTTPVWTGSLVQSVPA